MVFVLDAAKRPKTQNRDTPDSTAPNSMESREWGFPKFGVPWHPCYKEILLWYYGEFRALRSVGLRVTAPAFKANYMGRMAQCPHRCFTPPAQGMKTHTPRVVPFKVQV